MLVVLRRLVGNLIVWLVDVFDMLDSPRSIRPPATPEALHSPEEPERPPAPASWVDMHPAEADVPCPHGTNACWTCPTCYAEALWVSRGVRAITLADQPATARMIWFQYLERVPPFKGFKACAACVPERECYTRRTAQ